MYIKLRHLQTGQEFVVDTSNSRYRRLSQGFLNKTSEKRYFYKHIILTQQVESYHPKIVNYFFSALRRYYKNIVYIWTVEEQQRGVLHWHVIVGFPWTVKFGRQDVIRIQRYWKYGIVEVVPVRSLNLRYIMKYITKSLSSGLHGVRRVGSSLIEGFYRQSKRAIQIAKDWLNSFSLHWSDFWWLRGSAYVADGRHRLCVYRRQKEYEVVGYYDSDPF